MKNKTLKIDDIFIVVKMVLMNAEILEEKLSKTDSKIFLAGVKELKTKLSEIEDLAITILERGKL